MRRLAMLSIGSIALPFTGSSKQQDPPASMIHIPAGMGKKGKVGEMEIVFKFESKDTGGVLGVWESVIQPGELGAPPHYHVKTDEFCRVLEGTVTILTGDTVTEVKAGGWHLRPKGVVHTFWNSGKIPAKTIDLSLPGQHAAYMQELATMFENGKRPGPAAIIKLEHKYDIHYRFDLLNGIIDKYGVRL
ncbi:MAG: cupin domain-containing protein [Sphingobacteriia bacterium]|nr:cupin domain-containing protein [Sphingobacteriia bacterium]